jgi:FMN phosphatase YigB (HAD superfamily)
VFVGDDPRWDVVGAQNAGVRPVLLGSSAKAPGLKAIRNLEDILTFVDEAPV